MIIAAGGFPLSTSLGEREAVECGTKNGGGGRGGARSAPTALSIILFAIVQPSRVTLGGRSVLRKAYRRVLAIADGPLLREGSHDAQHFRGWGGVP